MKTRFLQTLPRFAIGIAIAIFVGTSGFANAKPTQDDSKPKPPNVLLICIDDLKPWIGCYGDAIAKTPNIDRLASRGLTFDSAYCNQAVCSPSRNSLMTGLRPQTLGIYDLGTNFRKTKPNAVTVAEFFKQHNYHTASLGKIFHVGHGNGDDEQSWSVPSFRPKGNQYALKESEPDGTSERGTPTESAEVEDNYYGDGKIADEAIARLQQLNETPQKPFFLGVGFIRPHLPFVAPTKYWDLYDPQKIPLAEVQTPPEGAPSYAPSNFGELRNYKGMPKQGSVSEEAQRKLIHGYYAAISYTDAQIGKVLDELDRLQLTKNTIVVLWGDHGWHLGDHGIWCKHTNYEQAARIPLIVSAPGGVKGAHTKALTETVDIYPTLAELAGLPAPATLDGKSFAKTLQDTGVHHRDHAIHVYPRNAADKGSLIGRSIRTSRYRMVEWKVPGQSAESAEFELYDYESDPLERKNLASEKPEVVAQLQKQLATHPEAKPQWKENATPAPTAAPTSDRNAMFDRRDRNGDGKLTREEFLSALKNDAKAPARFERFDKNGDGELSRDEFVKQGK